MSRGILTARLSIHCVFKKQYMFRIWNVIAMSHVFSERWRPSLCDAGSRKCFRTIWYSAVMLLTVLVTANSANSAPDASGVVEQARAGKSSQADKSASPQSNGNKAVRTHVDLKRSEHLADPNQLESLFNTESLSALLNHRDDALRERDLSAGYFVPASGFR